MAHDGAAEPGSQRRPGAAEPVRSVARRVSELMERSARIETLEAENRAELKSWRWRAEDLQRRLTELEQMAKAVAEPSVGYISAQVIANSSGSFVRSAVINAGRSTTSGSGLSGWWTCDGLVVCM